jgi:hypothetical protein
VWGLLLLFTACYQPQEGCLDLAATNFDANADKNCCCNYPALQLNITQNYGSTTFKEGSIFQDAGNAFFVLKNVSFYLSDFTVTQNGQSYSVLDTVTLWTKPTGAITPVRRLFTDDFLLVRRSSVNNEIGVFRQEGSFDGIRFRLGLPDSALNVLPARASVGHPLSTQTDSMWRAPNGFVLMQVVVARDTSFKTVPDTISIFKKDLPDCFIEAKGLNIQKPLGKNAVFTMVTDYEKLLKNIRWTTGDKSVWKMQIISNIKGAFSVN